MAKSQKEDSVAEVVEKKPLYESMSAALEVARNTTLTVGARIVAFIFAHNMWKKSFGHVDPKAPGYKSSPKLPDDIFIGILNGDEPAPGTPNDLHEYTLAEELAICDKLGISSKEFRSVRNKLNSRYENMKNDPKYVVVTTWQLLREKSHDWQKGQPIPVLLRGLANTKGRGAASKKAPPVINTTADLLNLSKGFSLDSIDLSSVE